MHTERTTSKFGRGVIEHYREYLPVAESTAVISLSEGDTPLVFCPQLSKRVGRVVFVKNEGVNPTGSFKDRGMTLAVSKAKERGATALICASTGNTSASAAAYAARAGISCVVILPAGKIATGKLLQAFAYGAKIVAIDGNFDDALRLVRELGEASDLAIVNSINPDRIAGQKTAAFEIVDVLGDAPDFHLLPVGNAGNITAYWAGYREYHALGWSTKLPAMIGFQAAGAAPIFYNRIVEQAERWRRRFASAIQQVGNKPAPRSPNHMERLMLLVTKKFLRRRPGLHSTREFLSNLQVRPPLRGFLNAAIQKRQHIHFRRSTDRVELFAPSPDMD